MHYKAFIRAFIYRYLSMAKKETTMAGKTPSDTKKNVFAIALPQTEISQRAYQLYSSNRSWNECVEMLAEAEAKLAPAVIYDDAGEKPGETLIPIRDQIVVNLSHLKIVPDGKEISRIRGIIQKFPPNLQDLQWYVAERELILDQVREKLGIKK
jgi:hypothetical protein